MKYQTNVKCYLLPITKLNYFWGGGEGIKQQQMAPNSERLGKELIIYPSSATLQESQAYEKLITRMTSLTKFAKFQLL